MWETLRNLFDEYMGTGLIVIFFVISLIYLWVQEKRKYVRILFVYVPVILLCLFFQPLFAKLVYNTAGREIYYRLLWLLPVTVTIAFAAVTLYLRLSGKRKIVFALTAAGMIMVSGSFIYRNPYFQKAENFYHVPDCVVHICDAIVAPGREVMAVFPLELVQYVRQYEPTICMPYGREMTVESWYYFQSDLLNEMERDVVNLDRLAPLAKEKGCHYIILSEDKKMNGSPEKYGWEVFDRMDGYVIYRDTEIILEIPVDHS